MDVQRDLNRLCEQYGVDVQRLQIRQAMVTTSTLPMRDNLPMPEMPLMEVLLDIIVAMMAANLCGGGGIALIASGPVGLVIGAAIGLIAMFVSRPALDKLTRPLMRQMNIPKLLRKTANEQRLLSDSNQKKMAQTIRDALAEDEALQVGLCTQIGQCIDSAILRLTEEKGMAWYNKTPGGWRIIVPPLVGAHFSFGMAFCASAAAANCAVLPCHLRPAGQFCHAYSMAC